MQISLTGPAAAARTAVQRPTCMDRMLRQASTRQPHVGSSTVCPSLMTQGVTNIDLETKWAEIDQAYTHGVDYHHPSAGQDGYQYFMPPVSFLGPGALKCCGREIQANKTMTKALIVTDKVLHEIGATSPLEQHLETAGVQCCIFDRVLPIPTTSQVEDGVNVFKQSGADFFISSGGGYPHDAAKAIGIVATNGVNAGTAFNSAGLGYVYAMSHQLGGFYNLPHGVCNAVLLPAVEEFNSKHVPELFIDMAEAMDVEYPPGDADKAVRLVLACIRALSKEVGIPANLKCLGVSPEDFPTLATNALKDACATSNTVDISHADIVAIFQSAYDQM